MRISRRIAVRVRLLPLLLAWVLLVVGLIWGVPWKWSASLFTGNWLVQIQVPDRLLALKPESLLGLGLLLVALSLFAYALFPGRAPKPAPSLHRFYPLVFLFGVFLVVFGGMYLFDASFSAGQTSGGSVANLYLNYADVFARPFQSGLGLVILVVGVGLLTRGSFGSPTPTLLEGERSRTGGSAGAG